MPSKTTTIQYRQMKTDELGEHADLKAMLVDVLRRRRWDTNAKHRILDIDQDQSFVILNKLTDPGTWDGPIFAGQLIQLQEGSDVQAVTQSLDEDTAEFVLQNLNVGERTRVLKGALYFAVIGNHVGLIEGQQVRGRTLERYLTALLQKADELEPGRAIILNGKFLAGDGKELDESSEITVAATPNRSDERPARQRDGGAEIAGREAGAARDEGATSSTCCACSDGAMRLSPASRARYLTMVGSKGTSRFSSRSAAGRRRFRALRSMRHYGISMRPTWGCEARVRRKVAS